MDPSLTQTIVIGFMVSSVIVTLAECISAKMTSTTLCEKRAAPMSVLLNCH